MARVRYRISSTLVVVTPLHVGSGETRTVARVRGKGGIGDNERGSPEVAAIVRGEHGGQTPVPYIPGSSLKGALRRLAETLPTFAAHVGDLFGAPKSDDTGVMGAVVFRGAFMTRPGDAAAMPYADTPSAADLGRGVFVAARTGIDKARGTADEGRLYFQEMVAPQAEFALSFVIEGDDDVKAKAAAERMLALLKYVEQHGLHLGKSTADGNGLVKVRRTTHVLARIDTNTGELKAIAASGLAAPDKASARATAMWGKSLELHCRGPFLIVDSSYVPPKRDGSNVPDGPQVKAQRVSANLPLLLGSGVSGALRARAAWLVATDDLRAGRPAQDERPAAIVRSAADIGTLDPVERLFGATGFQALLRVAELTLDPPPTRLDITSVKLDRFSGAPIDGALFKCEAFQGVTLRLRLVLVGRGGAAAVSAADIALAGRLLADIEHNGLEIGHGVNKGFGWFEVREVADDA